MTKATRLASRGLCQRLTLGGLALLAVVLVSGCGAEADKAPATNPTATAVPAPGMTKDDYAAEMAKKAASMGKSGGGGPPPSGPGGPGMAPGGPPGAPGAPPGPPGAPK